MPVLFVPPTQVVPFDAERFSEQKKVMDDFRLQAVALWQGQAKEEIKTGVFRGGRTFEWNFPFDALLQTFFIYPSTSTQRLGEVARVAALFRKDNCQLLGSAVVWGSEWSKLLPSDIARDEFSKLKETPSRDFSKSRSPLRLNVDGRAFWGTTMAWITEAYLGDRLAAEGLVVHSDLSGLACFRTIAEKITATPNSANSTERESKAKDEKRGDDVPPLKRGHRQVRVILEGVKAKEPLRWPSAKGLFSYISLPLNNKPKNGSQEVIKESQFSPSVLSKQISDQLKTLLHDLGDRNIRIAKREGRFVTVERGLAYGLRIGMHLVGPDGAKLHVIRFDNKSGFEDAAILLIRADSKGKPLAEGSNLQLDPTIFPAQ